MDFKLDSCNSRDKHAKIIKKGGSFGNDRVFSSDIHIPQRALILLQVDSLLWNLNPKSECKIFAL
jgi:hypothetical protein